MYFIKSLGKRDNVALPVLRNSVTVKRKCAISQQRVRASRTEEENRCKCYKQDGGEDSRQSISLLVLWELIIRGAGTHAKGTTRNQFSDSEQ